MKNRIKFKVGGVYCLRHFLNYNGKPYTMAAHFFRVTKRISDKMNPRYPFNGNAAGFLAIIPCDSDGSRASFFDLGDVGYRCTIRVRKGVETVNTMGSHNDQVSDGYPEMVLTSNPEATK